MRHFSTAEMPPAQIAAAISPAPAALDPAAEQAVRDIVAAVRDRGDEAVVAYSRQFDWPQAQAESLRVAEHEINAARQSLAPQDLAALRAAVQHVRAFHEKQKPRALLERDEEGALLGWRYTPLASVGIYAPAGTAPLPSSLIMAAVPAQVAGVSRIAVATPPGRDGSVNPGILAAACLLEISEIYRLGGPWAIAALAYGTAAITAVDKIVGPGNLYVNLAKAMVAGVVGVDGFYGPSEVVILADEGADARLVAADLAAQAEHSADALAVLVTPSPALAAQVETRLLARLESLGARANIARRSLDQRGAAIIVRDLAEGIELANLLAPEHLEVMTANPEQVLAQITDAGCILLGADSPAAVSDYLAGPSHVLPTGRSARFASGLGVIDFMKRSSVVSVSRRWLARNAGHVARLARLEGLPAHERSLRARLETDD